MKAFQRKTIENLIRNKMEKWFKSFPDDQKELVEELRKTYIVTGGAIASMLQGEMPSDYDVYFTDSDVVEKLAKYYVSKISTSNGKVSRIEVQNRKHRVEIFIKSAGLAGEDIDLNSYSYFEHRTDNSVQEYLANIKNNKGKYVAQFITSNSISLSDDIQIITRFIGSPEDIHKNFDFIHATNYFTEKTGLVLNQPALESIMTKRLKYVGSLFPICTLFRTRKFYKRDWTISAGDIFKISYDISKLNLHDTEVLKEQLTGCDVAYFHEVISIIKSEISKRDLDRTYLFEIISKVFDQEDVTEELITNNEILIVE